MLIDKYKDWSKIKISLSDKEMEVERNKIRLKDIEKERRIKREAEQKC